MHPPRTRLLSIVETCYIFEMPTPTLAQAIGLNVRRLRQSNNLTLEAVAKASRERGLKWDNTRVANFEAGKVPPSLNTLVPLALALSDCAASPITLGELLASDSAIRINDVLAVGPKTLSDWASGKPISAPEQLIGGIVLQYKTAEGRGVVTDKDLSHVHKRERALVAAVLRDSGLTEARVGRALGISPTRLAILSVRLWGRSFAAERDHRAPANASAQGRGQISRELKAELAAVIATDGHS